MLAASELRKQFDELVAVDGVSLTVTAGSIFGLLGPNGAGKTTTISIIGGLLTADGGKVTIAGQGGPAESRNRRLLGQAPQALALYDQLTADENLAFFGKLYGLTGKKLKERIDWCLELSGLSERRQSRVGTFSGGMKRRLNLACALVHDPPIVLLDEPTVGVDPQSRHLIFERIEQLRDEGRAILYTTHYMEEAQRLCDRVAIIDHGKILDCGTVPDLIARHGGVSVVTADLERPPDEQISLPGELTDLHLRFESARPLEEISQLVARGVVFTSLRIDRPDLETVFLQLTGRRLRD
ncbi:MAG: ABC transporter ATP-binding protein [Candidatus Zixiibacteriota bacterium]|nr:MAG: ABC transporter ATP-binding protein [candidate division Zixibacteria bacterium]